MWSESTFLQNELNKTEEILKKSLRTRNKSVEEALIRFMASGGKRLRPAFAILGATFGEYKSEVVLPIAAAIEIIHMATLIHDDIIDNAKFRRGSETIHSMLGKDIAVYTGDFLFTRAFMLVAELAEKDMLKRIAQGASILCDSEIAQNEQRYNKQLNIKNYLRKTYGKTAILFSLSLGAGAHKAGCSEKLVRKLGIIGRNMGMAFQIIDDILDFTGKEETVGKPLLNDAVQGIYTLPIVYAMKTSYKDETLKALDTVNEDNGAALLKIIAESGALEKSKKTAQRYIDKAVNSTLELPDAPGKSEILRIISSQLERKF